MVKLMLNLVASILIQSLRIAILQNIVRNGTKSDAVYADIHVH